jgi:hypothetical protein
MERASRSRAWLVAFATSACAMAGATAACSWLTATDGLIGAPADGGPDDARREGEAEGGVDVDALPAADAGTDARWCSRPEQADATFCADFDDHEGVTMKALFPDSLVSTDGGAFDFDTEASTSPPRSALGRIVDGGACTYGAVRRVFSGSYRSMHIEFSMRTGNAAGTGDFPGGYVAAFFHQGPTGTDRCLHILANGPSSAGVTLQYPSSTGVVSTGYDVTRYAVLGKWTRFAIDVDGTGATPTVRYRVDGEEASAIEPLPNCAMGGDVGLVLGVFCETGTREVRFDDVRVDLK